MSEPYEIHVGYDNLDALKPLILRHHLGDSVFIISDDNVLALYETIIKQALNPLNVHIIRVAPGEQSKSFETYQSVISELIEKNIKRDDFILAFGGGVVGDLAGFVASTLYRGIPYGQIPTTLLAQIDSSIGAKVAIDLKEGKNLVGAFYAPKFVFTDVKFLHTLAPRDLRSGQAEMIKAALIGDETLLRNLESQKPLSTDMIQAAINVKKTLVYNDPLDKGMRMILNFGHTFGHAIEKAHNYETYTHGEAISYGMVMALEIGLLKGVNDASLYERVKQLLFDYHLIETPLLTRKSYAPYIKHDKKHLKDGIHFIALKAIENPHIMTLQEDDDLWTKPL